ncbi:MAG: hypothetical protein K6G11_07505, partial [Lachnospiraceae bacterium]|nr:hypothetical protein [Lachnospiraceae bacterium]
MKFIADENLVKVCGRTVFRDNVRYLGYSGSGVAFKFRGKKACAAFISDASKREDYLHAFVAVFAYEVSEESKAEATDGVWEERVRKAAQNDVPGTRANSYGVKLDLGGDNFEKRIEIDADEKEVVLY